MCKTANGQNILHEISANDSRCAALLSKLTEYLTGVPSADGQNK